MVYCPDCGTKNEDTAKKCVQCGESLYFDEKSRPTRRSAELCHEWDSETGEKKLSQRGILIIGAIIVAVLLYVLLVVVKALFFSS